MLTALIPQQANPLYPTLGIDVIEVAELDGETVISHAEWLEAGAFEFDEDGDPDTEAQRDTLDNLAYDYGYRIDWGAPIETLTEYTVYPISYI